MADRENKASPGLIPPHGGYRELRSYQNAEIVYRCDGRILRPVRGPPFADT